MRRTVRVRCTLAALYALATLLSLSTSAAGAPGAVRFGSPVPLAPDGGQAFEPRVIADRFGNLFATAPQWEGAPVDARDDTRVRASSWAWWSADDGATWQNVPIGPEGVGSKVPALEGDIAVDDAGYVYFVDWNGADVALSVARAEGRGELRFVHYNPQIVTVGLDDRPWLAAFGNGNVLYFANETGNTATGSHEPRGGSGRTTVYRSTDHGRTFTHEGHNLPDSGWCRPVADRRTGSRRVVVACNNDVSTLYSFVTDDGGRTWQRYVIGTYPQRPRGAEGVDGFPTVGMSDDGTVSMLHVELSRKSDALEALTLYRSRDGRKWTRQDVTPARGRFVYAWLAVARDGRLGLATYYQGKESEPWRVYGAVWRAGGRPRLVAADPAPVAPASYLVPPGDFLTSEFTRDGKLAIAYTRTGLATEEMPLPLLGLSVAAEFERYAYFVRTR